jgi:hypothetical protein
MGIGVDLDNTIVCYDELFARVAIEKGLVSQTDIGVSSKYDVKSEIQRLHGNDAWTALQGEVYGARLSEADPFPGVVDFFRQCRLRGIPTCIISHKTRYPALGPRYNLRQAALAWLEKHGWFETDGIGICRSDVEFHDTLSDKVDAIGRRCCRLFIDDMPEVFAAPNFPVHTSRVLFDPGSCHTLVPGIERASTWDQIADEVIRTSHERNLTTWVLGKGQ